MVSRSAVLTVAFAVMVVVSIGAVFALTAAPVTAQDDGEVNETVTDESGEVLAQLGDHVTITGWEDREGDEAAIHFELDEPTRVGIDKPYGTVDSVGVGEVEDASLEETRLSRGEQTLVVTLPDSDANHKTVWVHADGQRVDVTFEITSSETAVSALAPMAALLLGAVTALTAFGYGAWRAIRKGKNSVRRAKP